MLSRSSPISGIHPGLDCYDVTSNDDDLGFWSSLLCFHPCQELIDVTGNDGEVDPRQEILCLGTNVTPNDDMIFNLWSGTKLRSCSYSKQ